MESPTYEAYLESQIVAADALELVRILYRSALDNLHAAAAALAASDLPRHTRHLGRAMAALNELAGAVDVERGGEIARNLSRLYVYVLSLLAGAAASPSSPALVEAANLLTPLLEAWDDCRPGSAPSHFDQPGEASEYSPLSCCG